MLRRHQAAGATAPLLAAYAAALSLTTPSLAKTPGELHCYNGICHRVKTVAEMAQLVGTESEAITSFYDTADRDPMNAGTITSSGEAFDADSDSHAASSLYPDGTELLIWNPKNRHAAHIRVNDFGPFYMLRTIDVTRRVAERLEFNKTGVARLRVAVVWAPSPEAARYRRRRTYPTVEGYVGRLDYDQFVALKSRLIATGASRNVQDTTIMASTAPTVSLGALPAYANAAAVTKDKVKAAILNTPRFWVSTQGPAIVVTDARSGNTLKTRASAQAIAAASRPAVAIVAAYDAEVATAVASLETRVSQHVSSPDLHAPRLEVTPRAVSHDASFARPWVPNSLMWQQLLAALGILSAATLGWRTRTSSRRLQPASTASAIAMTGPIGTTARVAAPVLFDNVIALPLLPRRPIGKSMDELRDEAVAHMEAYEYGLAEGAYRQLLAARDEALGSTDPLTAYAERQLADSLREQGRYAAAEPHYRRAHAAMTVAVGETHPAVADVLDEYAVCLFKQGCGAEAERAARQSLTIRRANGASSREYAVTLSIVAETLRAQGQLPAAEAEHRTAWSLFIAVSGQDSLDAAASMTSIGTVLGELGRFGPAEDLLNAGTRILSSVCGHDHPVSASGYGLLGELYRHAGALDAARTMQQHALQIRESTLGDRHPDTIETMLSLALIATEQFRMDDAQGLLGRALDSLIAGERNHLGPQSRVRRLLVALSHHHDTNPPQRMAAE
ncbi:MAG: tetratricopeptide repeat protein [Hyphomicrobiaceae bacterium]